MWWERGGEILCIIPSRPAGTHPCPDDPRFCLGHKTLISLTLHVLVRRLESQGSVLLDCV
jgi:hypothetical protein